MKAALVVCAIAPDPDAQLSAIMNLADEAAAAGAGIVVFPEAVLTGLANDDNPEHDLPLGQAIPGPITHALAVKARQRGIYLAIGLLEREQNKLYDSAVLFSPTGEMIIKYRRIDPRWHGKKADPSVYCQGTEMPVARTPHGSFAFLICGDLFNDNVISLLHDRDPNWLLYPFARGFDDSTWDQERWDKTEKSEYIARVKRAGVPALMANSLADKEDFGGAMAVNGDGSIIGEYPLGKPGILLVDMP